MRNMSSIGFNIKKWVDKGLLNIQAVRPTMYGLEMHLGRVHSLVKELKPAAAVFDPITNLTRIGEGDEVRAMLTRLIDFLKNEGVTTVFTSLTKGGRDYEYTDVEISSLMDTWLLLRSVEYANEGNACFMFLRAGVWSTPTRCASISLQIAE